MTPAQPSASAQEGDAAADPSASIPPSDSATQTATKAAGEAQAQWPDLPLGSWGPLEIRHRIGAGSFGVVYRAWDPHLGRDVALKLVRPDQPGSQQVESVLVEEGGRLARVRHPNVITVFGAGRHEGTAGIWMEFIHGKTLKHVVADGGPLGPKEATLIGLDVCRALAAVHAAGLVHRDVKAENIMREAGGRIVLMDFGAGREIGTPETQRGRTIGTPLYMAPELFFGREASPPTDIYSLGVLLYFIVTGSYPVEGRNFTEVAEAHALGMYTRLRDVRPDLPHAFVDVVERATARMPDGRFDTAGAFEGALAESLDIVPPPLRREPGQSQEPATQGVGSGWHAPIALRSSRRRLAIVALAAAVCVMVAAGVVRRQPWWSASSRPISSLAVLPLRNLSGPEQQYFSDGLTDLLTSDLARIAALRVISRTSANQYDTRTKSVEAITRELGVDGLVEGSVERLGDRVRVTARIITAASGSTQWTGNYERDLRDLFMLNGELARDIAQNVHVDLTERERTELQAHRPVRADVQDAYLKGWSAQQTLSEAGLKEAIGWFDKAVAIDPQYARAHAALANAYMELESYRVIPPEEARRRAVDSASRALSLDPGLPGAHSTLGLVRFFYEWDWAGAEASFRRAIELSPSDANAHHQYARFLGARGDFDHALQEIARALELDPVYNVRRSTRASILYYARRYDDAIAELNEALTIDRSFGVAHFGLARVHAAKHEFPQALAQLTGPGAPTDPAAQAELARVYAESGDHARARRMLESLTGSVSAGSAFLRDDSLAAIYAALGDRKRAFDVLSRAFDQRSSGLLWLKVDPRFDPLRGDPRFAAMVRRLGLTP